MKRVVVCLSLAACGGKAAAPAEPSNVAKPTTADKPIDEAVRKWGYPTTEQCAAAVEHIFATLRKDPEGVKRLGELDNAESRKQGTDECEREWYIARIDCVHAASTFAALDTCMDARDEVPDGLDVSAAQGHPTRQQCDAVKAHVVSIAPDMSTDWTELCIEKWRPRHLACFSAAQTKDDITACELGRR